MRVEALWESEMCKTVNAGVLTFSNVRQQIRTTFSEFFDRRRGKNTRYTLEDAALSAFSVFFMQSPSFLEHQRSMQDTQGRDNAQTLFGVHHIPTDNHIRTLLDAVPPSAAYPLFHFVFNGLQEAGVIDQYRAIGQRLLLALDGTEYFSSQNIHCEQCSTRTHGDRTTYSHTALTPVLVHPAQDKVIPLPPEFIVPQDGQKKQDCEINGARRWLAREGARYAALGAILLGDDLYCHEPYCRDALSRGFDFILVCKPDSHTLLYEWVDDLARNGCVRTVSIRRRVGKFWQTDAYRYVSDVPLRNEDPALTVQWCELTSTREDGKVLYHNAFATSLAVTDSNVAEIVAAGRARWKIENENNNILKTKGYHFEHSYGHGKQHLASLLATLILFAYLLHTLLDWMDDKYCLLRQKLPSRQRLFNDIRALTSYLCFESWDALLDFMIKGWSPPSPTATGNGELPK
jgi:hypothetical protein